MIKYLKFNVNFKIHISTIKKMKEFHKKNVKLSHVLTGEY
jgi:hypothetical protein